MFENFRMDDSKCFYLDELDKSLKVYSKPQQGIQVSFPSKSTIQVTNVQNDMCIDAQHQIAFETFLNQFNEKIIRLKLGQKKTNEIFILSASLVREFSKSLCDSVNVIDGCDAATKKSFTEVIENEMNVACEKFGMNSTAYRRQKEFEKVEYYVQPIEITMGLRWKV